MHAGALASGSVGPGPRVQWRPRCRSPSRRAPARRCDPSAFTFDTTAELEELDEIVGQDRAVEAVAFGIGIRQPGYNLYAMGPEGIGKYSLVRQYLLGRARGEPVPDDWCYVHDFADPRRPRALRLGAGEGRRFKDRIGTLDRELRAAIPAAFESEEYRNRRQAIESALKERRDAALLDFERRAAGRGVALLRTPVGVGLAALRDGKVLDRDEAAKLPADERERLAKATAELEDEWASSPGRPSPLERAARLRSADGRGRAQASRRTTSSTTSVATTAAHPADPRQLDALEADVIATPRSSSTAASRASCPRCLAAALGDGATFRRSGETAGRQRGHCPARGRCSKTSDPAQPARRIEHTAQLGALVTDFTLIRAGALHRANAGYLVLDARRLLGQPYAWEDLKRALRSAAVRIESPGDRLGLSTVSLEPEPIPLDTKVVLVAIARSIPARRGLDADFLELFEVQVDF